MAGTLYLLPNRISETPPENVLPEATLAKARTLTRFLAENAKSARAFLKAIGHPKPIAELEIIEIGHEPDATQFEAWLSPIEGGVSTAVVSESGCPAVADPGAGLVRLAHQKGIKVIPLVGPSSLLLTLMASGLNGQCFSFKGYLPIKEPERSNTIRALEKESAKKNETMLFIETPYRNEKLFDVLVKTLSPSTLLTVAVDVTGEEESIRTKNIATWNKEKGTLKKVPTVFALLAR